MSDHWIVEVLTDIRAFAEANGMPALAETLEGTIAVAAADIAARAGPAVPAGAAGGAPDRALGGDG